LFFEAGGGGELRPPPPRWADELCVCSAVPRPGRRTPRATRPRGRRSAASSPSGARRASPWPSTGTSASARTAGTSRTRPPATTGRAAGPLGGLHIARYHVPAPPPQFPADGLGRADGGPGGGWNTQLLQKVTAPAYSDPAPAPRLVGCPPPARSPCRCVSYRRVIVSILAFCALGGRVPPFPHPPVAPARGPNLLLQLQWYLKDESLLLQDYYALLPGAVGLTGPDHCLVVVPPHPPPPGG